MRSFVALGAISLVGSAALFACGDDSSDGGTAGSAGRGGSAGSAGTGGGAGAAGTAGRGGSGGTGGASGSGGGGGTGGTPSVPASNCTGCVQLTIQLPATPVNATNGTAIGYQFGAATPAVPFDLSEVTSITWRVQALTTNANFFVQPYLQNGPPEDAAYAYGSYAAIAALTPAAFAAGQWVDVTLNVAALGGGSGADAGADAGGEADAGGGALTAFDKSVVRSIGLNLGGTATAGAGLVSVEVDSVTVVGTSNFTTKTFTANVEGLTLNNYMNLPGALPTAFH